MIQTLEALQHCQQVLQVRVNAQHETDVVSHLKCQVTCMHYTYVSCYNLYALLYITFTYTYAQAHTQT